jgi:hypothetical protein
MLVADRARLTRTRLVMKPIKPTPSEPATPPRDRLTSASQLIRDLDARFPVRRSQHDPASKRERLRARRPTSPPLEHLPLLGTDHNLNTLRHDLSHPRR